MNGVWDVRLVLSDTVGSRLGNLFTRLRTRCAFSVFIRPRRRDHTRLISLLRRITSYSSGLSYQLRSDRKLGFVLLGRKGSAKVAFHTMPDNRRFASLLVTILGTSNGKGGFPSRFVAEHVGTLRKPVDLAACLSLAYAGYPSIIRTLGVVMLLGNRVHRRTMSKSVGRRRMRQVGMRTIPAMFTSNRRVRIKHDDVKSLLRGLRTHCNSIRLRTIRAGRCSMLMTNTNPTNTATTVCSTHGKLGMTVVTRHVNKRIGRAVKVRGLVSIPRAANGRLTRSLGGRLTRCRVSVLRGHQVRGIRITRNVGILSIGNKRACGTPMLVVTAKTG